MLNLKKEERRLKLLNLNQILNLINEDIVEIKTDTVEI
jgi:hypothetical protein